MNNYCVYIHRNKINNKVYIGLTKQKPEERWRLNGAGYKGQTKFWNAIQKYSWNNFDHIIYASNLSESQASEIEKDLIKKFDAIKNGYNVKEGGNIPKHSIKTIQKISNSMLGKHHSEQTKNQISNSEYHNKSKIKVYCVELNTCYESLSEASKKTGIDKSSISKVCKGEAKTAGGYHWAYQNQKPKILQDKRYRPVKCITTGKVYISTMEAARDTNSDNSNIKKVCDGKYKTTNKLKWCYISYEEYLQEKEKYYV